MQHRHGQLRLHHDIQQLLLLLLHRERLPHHVQRDRHVIRQQRAKPPRSPVPFADQRLVARHIASQLFIRAVVSTYLLQLTLCEGLGHAAVEKAAQIVQQIALHGEEEEGGRHVHEGKVELRLTPAEQHALRRETEAARTTDGRRAARRRGRTTPSPGKAPRTQKGLGPPQDTSPETASQGLRRRE